MTDPTDNPRHPHPHPPPAATPPAAPPPAEDVILQVRMRPAMVARMHAFATREGASVEALAALWLEEKLAEAGPAHAGAASPTD